MPNGKWMYMMLLIANCILSAFSQFLLKKASAKNYQPILRQYLNALVICGYGLFFVVLAINVYLLRFLPVSVLNPVAESLPIMLSFASGKFFFDEKISLFQLLGSILIIFGIIVILL